MPQRGPEAGEPRNTMIFMSDFFAFPFLRYRAIDSLSSIKVIISWYQMISIPEYDTQIIRAFITKNQKKQTNSNFPDSDNQ
jgi:hypothetical protein